MVLERPDGAVWVDAIDTTSGAARIVQSVPAGGIVTTLHPALNGGVVLAVEGGPLQTYDVDGELTSEIEIAEDLNNIITLDPTHNRLAIALRDAGLVIVDLGNVVERSESAGLAWDGRGAVTRCPS